MQHCLSLFPRVLLHYRVSYGQVVNSKLLVACHECQPVDDIYTIVLHLHNAETFFNMVTVTSDGEVIYYASIY